jgi:hypothetical protein
MKCVNNKKAKSRLTEGKTYETKFISDAPILIGSKRVPAVLLLADDGSMQWFAKNRFNHKT